MADIKKPFGGQPKGTQEIINGHCEDNSFSPMVSVFKKCIDPNGIPQEEIPFAEYFQRIKKGHWKSFVDQARKYKTYPDKIYNKYKANDVPCISAHGTFTQRGAKNLKQFNGFACYDWDQEKNPGRAMMETRERVTRNPYVYAVHTSLGGEGFAIFCRIDTANFIDEYDSLKNHLEQEYNIILDKGATGIERLRLVSYDLKPFLNEKARVWKNLPEYKPAKKIKKVNPGTTLFDLASRHLNDDNHHGEIMRFVSAARNCGFSENEVLEFITNNVSISPESAHSNPDKLLKEVKDIFGRYEPAISRDENTGKHAASIIVDYLISQNIQRNEITGQYEQEGRVLTEQELNGLFVLLTTDHVKVRGLTKQLFEIVLNSDLLPSFNPLKKFIKDYDHKNISGNITRLVKSLKLKDPKFNAEGLIWKWLVGMMASIHDDNYNPLMLILIGPKGCGKTEFFRRLLPKELQDYFAQSKFNEGKDSEALMCEKLLILNDELDGLHAREAKAFRAFVSSSYYYYRPPYAKANIRRKRQATVCGASNDPSVINDVTNNRRIIPVEITAVDHELYNSIDKTELLMEAYQLYKNGYDWNLNSLEMEELTKVSINHEITTIEMELVQKYIFPSQGEGDMTASDIMIYLAGKTFQKLSLYKIGTALQRCGFAQRHIRKGLTTQRVYNVTTNEAEAENIKTDSNDLPF